MDHPAILSPRPPTEAPRSPVLGLGCIGWQFLALAVCVNGLSATQGWNISIDWPFHFGAEHRSTTAWAPVFFLLWLGAQLGLLLVTFEQLGRLQDQPPWLRMPSLRGFPNPSDSSRLGYGLHQALIVLVIVVSLFAGGHFLKKTLLASVECGPTICWFDSSEPGVGVEFFPPWETPAFIAAYFIVAILWTRALWKLVRKHKGPR